MTIAARDTTAETNGNNHDAETVSNDEAFIKKRLSLYFSAQEFLDPIRVSGLIVEAVAKLRDLDGNLSAAEKLKRALSEAFTVVDTEALKGFELVSADKQNIARAHAALSLGCRYARALGKNDGATRSAENGGANAGFNAIFQVFPTPVPPESKLEMQEQSITFLLSS